MRWDQLFEELGREWEAEEVAAEQAEVAQRTRAELARVGMLARLRGSLGRVLRVHTASGVVEGRLHTVAADCLLLTAHDTDVLVPLAQVCGVEGLADDTVPDERVGAVERRLGLAAILRRLARDRRAIGIERQGTSGVHGTPALVGADFVELAVHEPGEVARGRAVRGRQMVPFAAIVMVRSDR